MDVSPGAADGGPVLWLARGDRQGSAGPGHGPGPDGAAAGEPCAGGVVPRALDGLVVVVLAGAAFLAVVVARAVPDALADEVVVFDRHAGPPLAVVAVDDPGRGLPGFEVDQAGRLGVGDV